MAAIGQGLQGTVTASNKGMVVKTTSARVAEKEQQVAEILKTVDPDQQYTLYGVSFTPIDNNKVQILMPYGGKDLDQFTGIEWLLKYGKPTEDNIEKYKTIASSYQPNIPKILKKFEELIAWVQNMHTAGIIHNDVGFSNMVWDGENLRLIDWGYAGFSTDKDFEKDAHSDIDGLQMMFSELKTNSDFILKELGLQKGGFKRRKTRKQKKSRKHKK
jgi:hypothetical protein